MKKTICLFLTLLLFAGCTNQPVENNENDTSENNAEQETQVEFAPENIVCSTEMDGIIEEQTFVTNDEGILLSTTSIMTIPYSLYGDITSEQKNELFEEVKAQFPYKGVTVTNKSSEDDFIIEIVFDYENVDFEELIEAGHVLVVEGAEFNGEIKFDEALSHMLSEGYTCVVK